MKSVINISETFLPCPAGEDSCLGEGQCAEGYKGYLCSACDVNYYRNGQKCEECTSAVSPSMIAAYAALVIVCLCILFRMNYHPKDKDKSAPIVVVMNFLQTVSLFLNTDMNWSNSVQGTLSACSLSSLDLGFASLECTGSEESMSFFQLLGIRLLVPFVLLFVVLLVYAACHVYNTFAKVQLNRHFLNSAILRSSMTVMLFMYMPLAKSILEFFVSVSVLMVSYLGLCDDG